MKSYSTHNPPTAGSWEFVPLPCIDKIIDLSNQTQLRVRFSVPKLSCVPEWKEARVHFARYA